MSSPVRYTQASRGPEDIYQIILHCTDGEGDFDSVTDYWYRNNVPASYHYGIDRDGKVHELVKPKDIAWHSGNWSVNVTSIGISLVGKASNFSATAAQLKALYKLMAKLSFDFELSLRRVYTYDSGRQSMPFGVGQHRNVLGADHTDISSGFPINRVCAEARAFRNNVYGKLKVEKR